MQTACLIWKQHLSSILPLGSNDNVEKILKAIPSTTLPFDIILWIRHFVPAILQIQPASMSFITDWCIEKTTNLQFSPHWPDVGLEFITNIFNIFLDYKCLLS